MDKLLSHIYENTLEAYVFDGNDRTMPFVFMSISKSAKTSIWDCLDRNIDGYLIDRYNANDHLSCDFSDYYKFCFVRNTYDRLFSAYTFFKDRGKKRNFKDFDDFLNRYLPSLDRYLHFREANSRRIVASHIQRQDRFVEFKVGDVFIDDIGHFENIEDDWSRISKKLDLKKQNLRHRRKNPYKKKFNHYSLYYNQENMALVRKFYRRELDFFGFKRFVGENLL